MYALLKPTTPFTAVVDPGKYAVYANFATEAAMKMTDKIFEQDKPIGPTARKSVQCRLLYHL